jgi:hypothetical protein
MTADVSVHAFSFPGGHRPPLQRTLVERSFDYAHVVRFAQDRV